MILVTGGAGYIGSHTCVALAAAGLPYLVLDNFSNSNPGVLERVGRITGTTPRHARGCATPPCWSAFCAVPRDGRGALAALRPWASRYASPCATTTTMWRAR